MILSAFNEMRWYNEIGKDIRVKRMVVTVVAVVLSALQGSDLNLCLR